MRHRPGPAAVVVPALLAGSCLPFAAPPAKLGFAVGPAALPKSTLPQRVSSEPGGVASQFAAGLYPLSWLSSQQNRIGDLGAGYLLEKYSTDGPQLHGPFLDLELFLWRAELAGHAYRLGAIASPGLLFWQEPESGHAAGASMEVKLEAELYGFTPGPRFGGDSVYGYAHGEWSLGMWLGGGYRDVFDRHVWTTWLGFSGRWPAFAGVWCCWLPGGN